MSPWYIIWVWQMFERLKDLTTGGRADRWTVPNALSPSFTVYKILVWTPYTWENCHWHLNLISAKRLFHSRDCKLSQCSVKLKIWLWYWDIAILRNQTECSSTRDRNRYPWPRFEISLTFWVDSAPPFICMQHRFVSGIKTQPNKFDTCQTDCLSDNALSSPLSREVILLSCLRTSWLRTKLARPVILVILCLWRQLVVWLPCLFATCTE